MLKLRRNAHGKEVTIIVKSGEGAFSRQLQIAFTIALTLHLTLFFGFHFTKLQFNYGDTPTLPTRVVAETPTPQNGALATTDSIAQLDKRVPTRPEPVPESGSTHEISPPKFELLPELANLVHTPFEKEESTLFIPALLSQTLERPQPIYTVVSGDIVRRFVADGTEKIRLPQLSKKSAESKNGRVVFSVAVDREGKICWYDKIENSSVVALDALAEKILATMEFTPSTGPILAKGAVEVHYQLTTKRDTE